MCSPEVWERNLIDRNREFSTYAQVFWNTMIPQRAWAGEH